MVAKLVSMPIAKNGQLENHWPLGVDFLCMEEQYYEDFLQHNVKPMAPEG